MNIRPDMNYAAACRIVTVTCASTCASTRVSISTCASTRVSVSTCASTFENRALSFHSPALTQSAALKATRSCSPEEASPSILVPSRSSEAVAAPALCVEVGTACQAWDAEGASRAPLDLRGRIRERSRGGAGEGLGGDKVGWQQASMASTHQASQQSGWRHGQLRHGHAQRLMHRPGLSHTSHTACRW